MAEEIFQIKTPLFEGPFDLLLFFIKRDELDIYDIPIAKITDDFLAYLQDLEKLNIELAGEFILVAATLMSIKAKMLLPRIEKNEEGEEIDPRADLVRHLLEYRKFKEVATALETMEENMMSRHERTNIQTELAQIASQYQVEIELQSLDLYKLLMTYQKVIERQKMLANQPVHQVVPFPYTIEQQKEWILEQLSRTERLSFQQIIKQYPDKIALIFNFLAVLELIQLQQISILLGEGFNNFWISLQNN